MEIETNKNNGYLLKNVFSRFLIYTLVIFGISVSLPVIIEFGDVTVFSENGPIEWLQLTVILLSVSILLFQSTGKQCDYEQLFKITAFLLLAAAVREMDSLFDLLIPFVGWKLPFALCVLNMIIINLKNKETVALQIYNFIRTRTFALLWCGFIIAIPYSQLVGNGKFLQLLMGDDYIRDYKRVIEELGEFMGYLFLMIGAIEAVLQQKE